jgi:hypothetical protein
VGLGVIWAQNTFKIIKLAGDVYQIDYLPMKLTLSDGLMIIGATLLLSFLATIIPARRAGRSSRWTCCAMSDVAPPALLAAEELEKEYRTGPEVVRVLRGASVTLAPGEFVTLIGASGVGKSTLLHLLGGLDRPHGRARAVPGRGPGRPRRGRARALSAPRRGIHLPVLQPARRHERAREHDDPGADRAQAPREVRDLAARPSPRSASAIA